MKLTVTPDGEALGALLVGHWFALPHRVACMPQVDGLEADGLQADGLEVDGLQADGLQADGLEANGCRS